LSPLAAQPVLEDGAELIRVRGIVQGVGFRPKVWQLAQRHGLLGWVSNDAEGVRIHVCGPAPVLDQFVVDLAEEAPPLARIDRIEREPASSLPPDTGFYIAASKTGSMRTAVAADAACCVACADEIVDPTARRFRYPFTNCTHCGPRLSIIEQIPYDRANTSMAGFIPCAACTAEYRDPADRRFHAQPLACQACGPTLVLNRADGHPVARNPASILDDLEIACALLQNGHVLAIQGLGGYQLACDATNAHAVERLREGKRREGKPFALMARDLGLIRGYADLDEAEAALLTSSAAPIVLLEGRAQPTAYAIDAAVVPGQRLLGFMLPNTPLHHLLLQHMDRPIVLTSGNLSGDPQAIEREDAHARLGGVAHYFLEHDRPISRRVDDSVARVIAGRPRLLRRARGYAPASLPLLPGFENAPPVLAYGGELKNTFCLLRGGTAILSPHIGDLQNALTRADHRKSLADFRAFFQFEPQALACDLHPDYAATQLAGEHAIESGLPLLTIQHHHAHIAACMAENAVPLEAPSLIGVALDGIGYGEDGTLWGGEFLLADYVGYERRGSFKSVSLLGGEAAIREPWRNTYAHIMARMGWDRFAADFGQSELHRFLDRKPRELLDGMLRQQINTPLASSCGRLFDAAAAAMGLARERAHYEGQAAIELEAAIDRSGLEYEDDRLDYPFAIEKVSGLHRIEPLGMWLALFGDLLLKTPLSLMAARFHRGLATAIVSMVDLLAVEASSEDTPLRVVALSGGVFQNRVLFERVVSGLNAKSYTVLTHSQVPCNDGGLALGQAAIAAARLLRHPGLNP
jgi:hydrogenase maturation protein HypF